LEEERALLRLTQAVVPPAHIPLDHRLVDEELRRMEDQIARTLQANETVQAISNVDDNLMDNTEFDAAATRFNASVGIQNNGENQSSSLEKDEAPLSPTEQVIDMTVNKKEWSVFHPSSFNSDANFFKKLEERSKSGLLDTLEDTFIAFRIMLEQDIFFHCQVGTYILSTC
jgi:hypothetical protein